MCICSSNATSRVTTVVSSVARAVCAAVSCIANLIKQVVKVIFKCIKIAFDLVLEGSIVLCGLVFRAVTVGALSIAALFQSIFRSENSFGVRGFERPVLRREQNIGVGGSGGDLRLNTDSITQNPTQVLLNLKACIEADHGFPSISYQDARGGRGVDRGGLTRDFVTKLFQSLYASDECKLPTMSEDEGHIPRLDPLQELPNLQTQIQCYQAIGTVFAFALANHEDIRIGSHFHPVFFELVHFLTDSHRLNEIQDIDKIPQSIFDGLFRIYVKSKYPLFTENDVTNLLKGNITEELRSKDVEHIDTFVDDVDFEGIARPVVLIAQAMCRQVYKKGEYGSIRGDTAEEGQIRGLTPKGLAEAIEGALSKELVLGALQWNGISREIKGFLLKWIRETTMEQLSKFVHAVTGSSALRAGVILRMERSLGDAIAYHTCGNQADLPIGFVNYEMFKASLEATFTNPNDGFEIS